MGMDKIIGLVEVTGSFVWSVPADAYGGGRYEKKELFQAAKGQCYPGDFEEATAALQDMCEAVVRRGVIRAIAEWRGEAEPTIQVREPAKVVEMPAPAPESRATDAAAVAKAETPQYQVGEKPTPQQAAPPEQAPPADKKPQTVIAERLQAKGVTLDDLKQCVRVMYGDPPAGQRFTQEQYVRAFTEAEKVVDLIGVEKFRIGLKNASWPNPPAPPQAATAAPATNTPPAESVVFSTDPAVVEARKQVTSKWPMWGVELVNVASLWCADHVKDANALEAFLITAGVTGTTPPGRIESLLAISRHLAIGALPKLTGHALKSKNPMSMIESDISKVVGKEIRFALDLPKDAVAAALDKLIAEVKK